MRGLLLTALACAALVACGGRPPASTETPVSPKPPAPAPAPAPTKIATFGGGCFWCTEAVFSRLEGVSAVASGFSGGTAPSPTYRQVCEGDTGHAEVIQVTFDPAVISYETLLDVFFATHDPTTPNQQGADHGPQYRSIILTHDEEQKKIAEAVKKRLDAAHEFLGPIVTEIVPFERFWPAEDYHQDYFALNPTKGYCQAVISPKVQKFEKLFKARLKPH